MQGKGEHMVENRAIWVKIGLHYPKNSNYSPQIGPEKARKRLDTRPCACADEMSSMHTDRVIHDELVGGRNGTPGQEGSQGY